MTIGEVESKFDKAITIPPLPYPLHLLRAPGSCKEPSQLVSGLVFKISFWAVLAIPGLVHLQKFFCSAPKSRKWGSLFRCTVKSCRPNEWCMPNVYYPIPGLLAWDGLPVFWRVWPWGWSCEESMIATPSNAVDRLTWPTVGVGTTRIRPCWGADHKQRFRASVFFKCGVIHCFLPAAMGS